MCRENQTEIYGTSNDVEAQDCLFRGTSKSTTHEKVALNFCGGFVSLAKLKLSKVGSEIPQSLLIQPPKFQA